MSSRNATNTKGVRMEYLYLFTSGRFAAASIGEQHECREYAINLPSRGLHASFVNLVEARVKAYAGHHKMDDDFYGCIASELGARFDMANSLYDPLMRELNSILKGCLRDVFELDEACEAIVVDMEDSNIGL